ncbi:MAG: exodeoxyribonuclease III, partial [Epsilonproteobacteria bacterium]|nr:exodeoxyribonuclease III [Campylobacterota bacterium]
FYKNLIEFIKNLNSKRLILLGDFNIIHKNIDVFDAKEWEGMVTFLDEEREIFNQLLNLGLYDSFRELYPNKQEFSFFEYRDKGFKRGLRLDYILMTKELLNKVEDVYIDLTPRKLPTPSDHTPVIAEIRV